MVESPFLLCSICNKQRLIKDCFVDLSDNTVKCNECHSETEGGRRITWE